ncbi:MAG: amine oxidase [Bacteroidota bacterium]|nr:amine oxidase [Bacteroidota bacterium]
MHNNPFSSFWMAGYECTDKLNAFGNRVDFLHQTGHLQLIDHDYQLLSAFNIKTVREGIRWSQVEKRAYQYDWSTVKYMLERGKAHGIQQLWDVCHFGFPDDLSPLHPMFARRFAALCRAFVKMYRDFDPYASLIVTPINEVSFLSWLGGDQKGTSPYCTGHGWQVKYALMRAYIEGVAALKEADPSIIILTTEPLINAVPEFGASEERAEEVRIWHNYQYQSVDMLCGFVSPELGGKPEYLDIVCVNYYYRNQWEFQTFTPLFWKNTPPDPRFVPLRGLLLEIYERFQKPIALTETSHPKEDRPEWMNMIGEETAAVIEQGVPFYGICLYPIVDRPDWDHLTPWHNAGLWDAQLYENEPPGRVLYEPYAQALLECQELIGEAQERANIKVA